MVETIAGIDDDNSKKYCRIIIPVMTSNVFDAGAALAFLVSILETIQCETGSTTCW
jgi:hypothetical protein